MAKLTLSMLWQKLSSHPLPQSLPKRLRDLGGGETARQTPVCNQGPPCKGAMEVAPELADVPTPPSLRRSCCGQEQGRACSEGEIEYTLVQSELPPWSTEISTQAPQSQHDKVRL